MTFLQSLFFIGIISQVFSFDGPIRLEWSLGSPLPVSKMLNSGTEQDLYCSIEDKKQQHPVLLQCPMYQGICMENCFPNEVNLHISCRNMTRNNMIIFRYRIKVFKNYEGLWKCQYKTAISRTVQLTVTNKPYINSLTAIPNPVWKGSSTNVTCQVIPIPGINGIQFHRVLNDNSTVIIPSESTESTDQYSDSIIINSATPGLDDTIQCMVFSMNGIITIKLLKINILYFPKRLQLVSSSSDSNFPVAFVITFQCSAEGGNPKPVLILYRKRIQEEPEKLIDNNILLSKLDNGAIFYCKMEKIAGVNSNLKSNEIKIKVKYPPDIIQLSEEPGGQLRESQVQTYVCISKSGSEPPSQIEWSMTDSFGKQISESVLEKIIEKERFSNNSLKTIKDSIRISMLRNYNSYTVFCSIIYEQKKVLVQKRSITVFFAPNNVGLYSNPLGPILKGTSVVLSCITGTSNPQSKIMWNKIKPGIKSEDVTAHSNLDLVPANYSGIAVSSTLNVHDVSKNDHGTIYKCIVSHAYINTEIIKEYFLNVLFPPIVQINSYPQPVEEGDQVVLNCRTNGGNPSNFSLYNFQWKFCVVNHTYHLQSNSELSDQPSSNIKKYCSQNANSPGFPQTITLNLSSVTHKQRGWYYCKVYSVGGSAVGYSFLNVLYPPILIRHTPERVYEKIGTDMIFKFEVFSNPLDIDVKWFFRQHQKPRPSLINEQIYETKLQPMSSIKKPILMKPYGRLESIVFDNYTVYLTIRSISYSDYGDYFCEVTNRKGKKWIQFQLFPSNDITIPESSIGVQFNGKKVQVQYEPPSLGHYTHLILRICSLEGTGSCKDMHISNPSSGKASTTLHRPPSSFSYRILVYNGSSLLQMTNPIQKQLAVQSGNWVEMSFEMMVAVIIGVAGIFILLFVALVALILLKCKHNKSKEMYIENNSIATSNSNRRQDYFLLNSSANTSLLKNGCHCFPNYPIELRSDNGSDHSAPSQGVYHPIMMRRKVRENGEMSSIHSGGSFQSPDVVLTEKTSIGSGHNPIFNGTPQYNTVGSINPTKVTFLNGRLRPFDNQQQDLSLPRDFIMPQNMVYAAVDDGINLPRLIPIGANNLHSEYPLYYQMSNQTVPKQYNSNSPLYSTTIPHCLKPSGNDNYRETSSSTNTDSNVYSGTQDPSAVDITNETEDVRNADINQNR